MLTWSRKISQKMLSPAPTGQGPDSPRSVRRETKAVPGLGGQAAFHSETGAALIRFSRAGYQALEPYGDLSSVKAGKGHVFAMMLSARASARGSSYLHRGLYAELQEQLKQHSSIPAAFEATLQALDKAFQRIHSSNGPVLAGLRLVVAYMDCATSKLYIASNGGCRCVVGHRGPDGHGYAAFVSRDVHSLPADASLFSADHVETVQLDPSVKCVTLGSRGLWAEVGPNAAMLRMQHFLCYAAASSHSSAAAALNNFALHQISHRLQSSDDPRMAALSEPSRLSQLWVGDRSQYKYASRQPVRRRRGDVHGDLSSVVLHFDWAGTKPDAEAARLRHSSSMPCMARQALIPQTPGPLAMWRLLHMHFVTFPRAHREARRARWAALIAAVRNSNLEASQQQAQQASKVFAGVQVSADSRHAVLA